MMDKPTSRMLTLAATSALAALVALPVALACAQSERSGIGLGDRAPMADHRMRNVDGQRVSIADAAGQRGTLVVFTCNHCPWAQAWESRLTELGNAYGSRGIGVIAINSNDPARAPDDDFDHMVERHRNAGMRFPYVVDATSGVARAFGATRTPEVYLFDRRGRLVYHGAIDDNAHEPDQVQRRYLRDALEAVVAGRSVPTAETRSIGCTIKFAPE
ncbi:MAG: thioredoxin family protein [Sandaracinaceae bacterium]